jgi:tetratricopeptide (TPR) repeat protein
MPATGAAARPPVLVDVESFYEWIDVHRREVLIAVALVVVVIGGGLLYRSAIATQAVQAEQALVAPEQALAANNLPLAQSDLRRAITRYGGTAAAAQASIMLAQSYYVQGKYVDGLAALEHVPSSGAAKPFASDVQALIGDGYSEQGRFREAGKAYQLAADRSEFPKEKARHEASAARAYGRAGDTATAVAIWTKLAADPKNDQAGEAKLRLGELTTKVVKP